MQCHQWGDRDTDHTEVSDGMLVVESTSSAGFSSAFGLQTYSEGMAWYAMACSDDGMVCVWVTNAQ